MSKEIVRHSSQQLGQVVDRIEEVATRATLVG